MSKPIDGANLLAVSTFSTNYFCDSILEVTGSEFLQENGSVTAAGTLSTTHGHEVTAEHPEIPELQATVNESVEKAEIVNQSVEKQATVNVSGETNEASESIEVMEARNDSNVEAAEQQQLSPGDQRQACARPGLLNYYYYLFALGPAASLSIITYTGSFYYYIHRQTENVFIYISKCFYLPQNIFFLLVL